MSDLAAWLTQILEEDERAVKRSGGTVAELQNDNYGRLLVPGPWMLADITAKRAIIDHMTKRRERVQFTTSDLTVLCILASAYADHPGYDESWRP